MAWIGKRRRWLEWVVIALVLGWIVALAWRHSVERVSPPIATQAPVSEAAP